jgi:hypothetical protein
MLWPPPPFATSPFIIPPAGHGSNIQLHLNDNIQLTWGNTSAAPDVWMDNNGTNWAFTSTSVDGAGTDGDLLTYTLGTDELTFVAHPFLGDNVQLRIGGSATAPDMWFDHDTTSTCWTSTDVSGTGTDGDMLCHTAGANELDAKASVDMNNLLLYDSVDQLDLGTACTDGRSQGTGAVCIGSTLQIDSTLYLDENVYMYAASAIISNQTNYGAMSVYSKSVSGGATSGSMNIYTGNNTNIGDYDTGPLNLYSGNTTTDGETGTITLKTGAAGGGAAKAGSILLQVHGANTKFSVDGATEAIDQHVMRYGDLDNTCTTGQIAVDTASTVELCFCQTTDTWYCIAVDDTTGPAD